MGILGFRKRTARARLGKLLKDTELPTFPALTLKVLEALRDPEVDFEDVAEAIQWDPGLVLRLLKTVNSAAFAPRSPIENVAHAVSYLGKSQLESLVIGVAVQGVLPDQPMRGFEPSRFWLASARRASLARAFSSKIHPARTGEAFTCGLLLDLAVPAMAAGLGDSYGELLEASLDSEAEALIDMERSRLGTNHAEVGSLLAVSWGLPPSLGSTIGDHHTAGATLLPAVRLVAGLRETVSGDTGMHRDDEKVLELAREEFGLEPDWTVAAIESSLGEAADLMHKLS